MDCAERKCREDLENWEYLAHVNAFKPMGTYFWQNFLIREFNYNSKYFNKYNMDMCYICN